MLNFRNCIVHVALAIQLLSNTIEGQAQQPHMDWKLIDIDGQQHVPFEDPTTRAVVLVFISTDCPIANAYQPKLTKLAKEYVSLDVRWFMIHPDPSTTRERAAEHAKKFGIEVPIVVDQDLSIARSVGTRVTPEVQVFVNAKEKAVYQGRIDNLHAAYGKKRASATTHELADALRSIIDGQPIAISKTEPVGCFIAFEDKAKAPMADLDVLKIRGLNVK